MSTRRLSARRLSTRRLGNMRRAAPLVLLLALLAVASPAGAVRPDERLADPALEARARALSQDLRCLVCQNQSIDDSDAPLAHDLRVLLRERLSKGDSDAEAMAYLTHRYGDYVLLRPPLRPDTWALWFGPAAVLVLAGGTLAWRARRGPSARPDAGDAPLSPAEERALAALLHTPSAPPAAQLPGAPSAEEERR